jgi:Spy/CpxP family protein refolding chaperone
MMNKPWKLVLLLVGIFIAGAVAGGFVAGRIARHMAQRRMPPDQWGQSRLKMLSEHLSLTPDQQTKLQPILQRDMDDLARIRNSSMSESRKIFERMEQDISALLTPEQKQKFDEMNRERHDRFQRMMHERGPGGPRRPHGEEPDGPPPPPPPPKDSPGGV